MAGTGPLPNQIAGVIIRETRAKAYRRITSAYKTKTLANLVKKEKLKVLRADGIHDVNFVGAYGMEYLAQAGVAGLDRKTMLLFQGFAAAVTNRVSRRQGMLELHQEVAAGAQAATVEAYRRNVLAVKRQPSYRDGEDRLPGKLLEALQSPAFTIVQQDGVLFGNTAVLDATAAHWYRLNFGAGARASQTEVVTNGENSAIAGGVATTTGIKFFKQVIDQYQLMHPPSEPFSMPFGVFFTQGGNLVPFDESRRGRDPFFPMYLVREKAVAKGAAGASLHDFFAGVASARKPTQGIAARRFLDAGMSYLVQGLYAGYTRLAQGWVEEALVEKGPYANYMDVDPETAAELLRHIDSLKNQVRKRPGH